MDDVNNRVLERIRLAGSMRFEWATVVHDACDAYVQYNPAKYNSQNLSTMSSHGKGRLGKMILKAVDAMSELYTELRRTPGIQKVPRHTA